jgi:tetratricopeptide (TPR) repeat protein
MSALFCFRIQVSQTFRLTALTIVCLCGIAVNGSAQRSPAHSMSAQDHARLDAALKAYDAQNDAVAEPILYDIATRYPSNFEANEALGSLYAVAGDAQKALPFLQHACTANPHQAVAHSNLGVAYLKLNRGQDAVRELKLSVALDPQNTTAQNSLGHALMAISDPAAAVSAFQSASDHDPSNADIRYNWSLALFESNAPKQADAVLSTIPEASLTDEAHVLSADIAERLGRFQDAVKQYQLAMQLNPSSSNIYSLIVELLRHWTWDEALKVAKFGIERYPQEARFRSAAGIALFGDSKFSEASVYFSQLLASDPRNELYADLLGRSCETAVEAADMNCNGLEAFARAHPQNARISVYAAGSILHKVTSAEDLDRAKQLLDQAVADDPKLAEAYYQLGVLDQRRDQWIDSAAALEKAVELQPTFSEAHYRLSRAYSHLKRRNEAEHEIELQQKYSQQSKDQLNAHMQEVVRFLIKPN